MQADGSSGDGARDAGASSSDASSRRTDQADPGSPRVPRAKPARPKRPPKSPWAFFREVIILFAIALGIALLLKAYVLQPFYIPSSSMEDTLLIGDRVLVNKFVYHLRPIHRGDIVVFNGTGSWNPPSAASKSRGLLAGLYDVTIHPVLSWIKTVFGTAPAEIDYVKRVIGLPGDHVACCNADGQVTVNGVPLHETHYLIPAAEPSQYRFSVVVPPGRLWVMGDNRPESADSRLHDCGYADPEDICARYDRDGTIPEDKVVGRVFLVLWPTSQFKNLPIPATFQQGRLTGSGRGSTAGLPLLPAPPCWPLAGGLAAAVPLAVFRRRHGRGRARRSRR